MNILNYTNFEDFITKDISSIEEAIGANFELKNSSKDNLKINLYKTYEFETYNYFNFPSKGISVITEKNNKAIKMVKIHFQGVINNSFYDAFIAHYGEPDHILIIENRQLQSESTIKKDTGTWETKKYTMDLREGSFEENPLYIVWKKGEYQIKAYLRHEQSMSEISFSLLTDRL